MSPRQTTDPEFVALRILMGLPAKSARQAESRCLRYIRCMNENQGCGMVGWVQARSWRVDIRLVPTQSESV
jgi:hypothetical protein